MGQWTIVDGHLVLSDQGKVKFPSVEEVFRSVIEQESVWDDVPPGKSGAAAQLKFSRYPAHPHIRLDSVFEQPTASFAADLPDGEVVSVSSSNLRTGHFINGQTWYPLETEAAEEIVALLVKLGLPEGGKITSLRTVLGIKRAVAQDIVRDHLTLNAAVVARLTPPPKSGPSGVSATLYPYQLDGWRWLRVVLSEGVGGLLGDEMGLGKTLQVISVIADPGEKSLLPVLVLAPGSLLENWCRELAKFAPDLRVLKHHGPLRSGSPTSFDAYDVIVSSYDSALRDQAMMSMREWGVVVLDEAQNIRNPNAQRTRAVKALRRRCGLAVTGTPMENRLRDLWSIIDFATPGYLGDEEYFATHFAEDVADAVKLEPLASPLILRRLVSDVAKDLPHRIDIPQILELEPESATQYEALRLETLESYGPAGSLVALTKLRMFCAYPGLVDDAPGIEDFVKLQRLDEIATEVFASSEKLIIFTSYTKMADILATRLAQRFGVFAATLDGRIPIPKRQELLDRFSEVEGGAVLVLNPKAGGAGLNITAANHVVHYNLEWNPAVEDQASARSHRRGQTKPVTIHRFIIADTVEEAIEERISHKRALADAAIVGVAGEQSDLDDIFAALQRSPMTKKSK